MKRIEFTVFGTPRTAGSKIKGRWGVIRDDNRKLPEWKAMVVNAAAEAFSGELLRCPLAVWMTFYRARPKGHFGTGRNANILKQNAPRFPDTQPDVLKLARGTEDALTGVIWKDDAQTVDLILAKRFGEPERAEIVIEVMGGELPLGFRGERVKDHAEAEAKA